MTIFPITYMNKNNKLEGRLISNLDFLHQGFDVLISRRIDEVDVSNELYFKITDILSSNMGEQFVYITIELVSEYIQFNNKGEENETP